MVNIKLYGIIGFMLETIHGGSPFGGFFSDNSQGRFKGNLVDQYGPSRIEGKLGEDSFEFEKNYLHRASSIFYKFEKKGDLWVGGYQGDEAVKGGAVARVFPSEFSAEEMMQYVVPPEEFFRELTRNMVKGMEERGEIVVEGEGDNALIHQTEKGKQIARDFAKENPEEAEKIGKVMQELAEDEKFNDDVPF